MAQYINKSALVAEIYKLIENGKLKCQQSEENNDYERYVAWSEHVATCGKILSFLNTLEVKEVNSNDAFIEKACEWLKENFSFDEAGYCKTNIYSTESMIYNFKNTLGGEL